MFNKIKYIAIKLFFWLFSMIPFHLESQENRSKVGNERDKMVHYIQSGDFDKIKTSEIFYDYEMESIGRFNYLMVWEQELLDLIKGNYSVLLSNIVTHEEDYFGARNNRTHLIGLRFMQAPFVYAEESSGDEFNRAILNYLSMNRNKIINEIKSARLKESQELFLIYYLQLNIYYADTCVGRNEDLMGEHAKQFVDKFPSSVYAKIVKKYSSYKRSTSRWGTEATIGIVSTQFNMSESNNFGNYFGPIIGLIPISFGARFNDFALNYQFQLTLAGVRENPYKDWSFVGGYEGLNGQLTLGYQFHSSLHDFTFTPFIGVNDNYLFANLETPENIVKELDMEEPEIKTVNHHSRNPLIGLNIDFNKDIDYDCEGKISRRSFNRLQLGMSKMTTPIGNELVDAPMFFVNFSFGISNQREKRIPYIR